MIFSVGGAPQAGATTTTSFPSFIGPKSAMRLIYQPNGPYVDFDELMDVLGTDADTEEKRKKKFMNMMKQAQAYNTGEPNKAPKPRPDI